MDFSELTRSAKRACRCAKRTCHRLMRAQHEGQSHPVALSDVIAFLAAPNVSLNKAFEPVARCLRFFLLALFFGKNSAHSLLLLSPSHRNVLLPLLFEKNLLLLPPGILAGDFRLFLSDLEWRCSFSLLLLAWIPLRFAREVFCPEAMLDEIRFFFKDGTPDGHCHELLHCECVLDSVNSLSSTAND